MRAQTGVSQAVTPSRLMLGISLLLFAAGLSCTVSPCRELSAQRHALLAVAAQSGPAISALPAPTTALEHRFCRMSRRILRPNVSALLIPTRIEYTTPWVDWGCASTVSPFTHNRLFTPLRL